MRNVLGKPAAAQMQCPQMLNHLCCLIIRPPEGFDGPLDKTFRRPGHEPGNYGCLVLGICCSDGRGMVLELPGLDLTQSVGFFHVKMNVQQLVPLLR